MNVALYIRVSTERQANEGDSLEEQESELRKYCDFRKFNIHKLYIERGKSGGNTNRPEYQKLVKDIQNRKINAVVVKKLDRLSRSLLDFENLMRLMNENQVEFISIKENFDTTTAMGKAMLRVALVFAQLEREQTSERIADVMTHRASLGLFNGGRRLFGYSIVEKELVPYPKEKQIVEMIFSKFLETRSTSAVMHYLNENSFKYRDGKLWDERQIQKMLQQESYIGKVNWGKQVYIGIHQPIISEATFEKVHDIFASKTYTKIQNTTSAILAKKVFCSWCGSPLAPSHTTNRHKQKYFYYRCTGSKDQSHKCQRPHFSLTKLETRVSEIVLSLSEQFSSIENKLLKHNDQIASKIQEHEKSLHHLEGTLNQLKQKKDKYLDTLLSSQFLSKERELINTKITEMETEEKQLQTATSKLETIIHQAKEELLSITEIKKLFVTYRAEYPFSDRQTQRIHLTKLIERIDCKKNALEIKFNLIPDTEYFSLET
jgi:site-specific DNA recombinase